VASQATAAPITYTLKGVASGTVGTQSFSDAMFTIQGVSDTADVFETIHPTPPIMHVFHAPVPAGSATINISGFGSGIFPFVTEFFIYQEHYAVGISRTGGDLLDMGNIVLTTYDLKSSIGPVVNTLGPPDGLFNGMHNVPTSLGLINFSSLHMAVTFTATTAVPEPSTLTLLGLGALSLLGYAWHRRIRVAE